MPTPIVVDLSHYNEVTDFAALAAAGILGVIHKCTEGADYVDTTYATRRRQAENTGMLWGAYHYLRPGDMAQQARHFLDEVDLSGNSTATLLVADHEDSAVSLLDLKEFLSVVEAETGQAAVVYSGHLIKVQLGATTDAILARHKLWLAQYAPAPVWPLATWPQWWLWQYTDKGGVDGVTGDVDLNAYNGTVDALIAEWPGASDAPAPVPVPPVSAAVPEVMINLDVPPGVQVSLSVNGGSPQILTG